MRRQNIFIYFLLFEIFSLILFYFKLTSESFLKSGSSSSRVLWLISSRGSLIVTNTGYFRSLWAALFLITLLRIFDHKNIMVFYWLQGVCCVIKFSLSLPLVG